MHGIYQAEAFLNCAFFNYLSDFAGYIDKLDFMLRIKEEVSSMGIHSCGMRRMTPIKGLIFERILNSTGIRVWPALK